MIVQNGVSDISTRKEVERRTVNVDHMAQRARNIRLDRQLAELQAYAVEVFGDHDAALRWLGTGLFDLDDLSAREIVTRTALPAWNAHATFCYGSNTECTVSQWPPAIGCFAGSTPLRMPPAMFYASSTLSLACLDILVHLLDRLLRR
jgi:hypothetical protein